MQPYGDALLEIVPGLGSFSRSANGLAGVMSLSQVPVLGSVSVACSVLVVTLLGFTVEKGVASTDCVAESKF